MSARSTGDMYRRRAHLLRVAASSDNVEEARKQLLLVAAEYERFAKAFDALVGVHRSTTLH